MATKKAPAAPAAKAAAPKPVTVGQIIKKFGAVADNHMDIVRKMRAKVAPGARIILAHGETEK
jgi:hypothetical protein